MRGKTMLEERIRAAMDAALFKHAARMAAEHLAGRPTEIRWRAPRALTTTGKTLGLAGRRGDVGIIEIDPSLSTEEIYPILLHEAAHLRLHWAGLPDEANPFHRRHIAQQRPRTLAAARADPREPEADRLAGEWERYARRRVSDGEPWTWMLSLLTWTE